MRTFTVFNCVLMCQYKSDTYNHLKCMYLYGQIKTLHQDPAFKLFFLILVLVFVTMNGNVGTGELLI